mgnify:FL=1
MKVRNNSLNLIRSFQKKLQFMFAFSKYILYIYYNIKTESLTKRNALTMRRIVFVTVILFAFASSAFTQVEDIAMEVLKAYKTRDVELLKKNASGMFKKIISEEFLESENSQAVLNIIDNWDGKIREVRYSKEKVMGETTTVAAAFFADNPNNDEICFVTLTRKAENDWVIFGNGIMCNNRSEFEKMSTKLPGE